MPANNDYFREFFRKRSAQFQMEFYGAFNRVESVRNMIFGEVDHDAEVINFNGVSELGLLDRFDTSGELTYDEVFKLGNKSFYLYPFAKGVQVTREMIRFNQYPQVIQRLRNLGTAAARTAEHFALKAIDGCNSPTFSFNGNSYDCATPDGIALAGTGHTYASEASVSGTQNNAGTSAFTADNLEATLTAMRQFKGYRGEDDIQVNPNLLVVPEKLRFEAERVLKSMGRPGTANNDVNVFSVGGNEMQLVVSNLLTSGNTTATTKWFVVDNVMSKDHAQFLWAERPDLEENLDFNTKKFEYSVYAHMGVAFDEWRWIYGQFPT